MTRTCGSQLANSPKLPAKVPCSQETGQKVTYPRRAGPDAANATLSMIRVFQV